MRSELEKEIEKYKRESMRRRAEREINRIISPNIRLSFII